MIKLLHHEIADMVYRAKSHCSEMLTTIENKERSFDSSFYLSHVNRIDFIIFRIKLLLKCFDAFEANMSTLANLKNDLDVFQFLNTRKELFREELDERCISFSIRRSEDYVDNCIHASEYYPTALCGLLYQALRSACFGSRIICNLFPDYLEVSYVGNTIPKDLINSISNENDGGIDSYGLEYMLYAAKKIIDANGSSLSILSTPMFERNYYAELLVAEYLNSISESERYTFIHKDIPENDYPLVERIYDRINHQGSFLNRDYLNLSASVSDYIHRYQRCGIDISLIEFEDDIFDVPISKTNMKIYYGQAKRHIADR